MIESKNTKRIRWIPSGMNLWHVPVSAMKPGDDNDFVADLHSVQALYVCWKYLWEGIGTPSV